MSNRTLTFSNFKDHVKTRSMWIGSSDLIENEYWVINDIENDTNEIKKIFKNEKIVISEALVKTFDEILVNAIDQYVRSATFTKQIGGPVTYIKVSFNTKTGEIIVENDGAGIPVYYDETIKKYSVEAVISREFSGSNFDDKKNPDRVVGGVNGLGIKLINIYSKRFEVETVDVERNMYYNQVCENNMDIINKPEVIDLQNSKQASKLKFEQCVSHTTIKFIPDYAKLCKASKMVDNNNWINEQNLNNFKKIIEARIFQTAAFLNCIDYRYELDTETGVDTRINYNKKAKIYFNNTLIKVNSLSTIVEMFGIENSVSFKIDGITKITVKKNKEEEIIDTQIRFPWYICIGHSSKKELEGIGMSVINGLFLPKGGSHVNMIFKQLESSLTEKLAGLKLDNPEEGVKLLKKLLFIFDIRQIPLPQFSSQTKDSIRIGTAELNQMKKLYIIPDNVINKVWKFIKDIIEYKILSKSLQATIGKKKEKNNVKIRKYEKAEKLGIESGLFIPEGDSAAGPIRNILTLKESPISRKRYGMYNIQGVPPNVCKKTKEIQIDGLTKILQSKDLQKNIALQGLATVLKLDYNATYYYGPDPEIIKIKDDKLRKLKLKEEHHKRDVGDEEYKKLNYGHIIISTDQDLDGIGNICSLIIVYILTFWPELVKRGFIKRLQTPLIRVYMPGKKGDVYEFYSYKEQKEWVKATYGNEENVPANVKEGITYYKGLGTHSKEEVADMGINIFKNIIDLTWDEAVSIWMKIYYGKSTGDRKEILLTPVTEEYSDDMLKDLKIPISSHFNIETKTFQLYAMRRKLKHAIDGMVPSQRKAFAGARKMFKKEKKAKVYQITGYVTTKMHYQHGDESMNQTIIKMAQNFTGSNNLPMFSAISDGFGDRVNGRGEAASPRYIYTRYNFQVMNLMFPPDDDWLLSYVYEDGKQSEPEFYVPIIPYSILETSTTPGTGWKIDVWARDYDWTMKMVKNMIKHDFPAKINDKVISKPYGFLGKVWIKPNMRLLLIKTAKNKYKEVCLGEYRLEKEKNRIVITQLPLKMWSYKFKCGLLGIDHKSGKTEDEFGQELKGCEWVDDVIDNTGNDIVEIIVKFKPEGIDKIFEKYKDHPVQDIDPIEKHLKLYKILSPNLNMMSVENSVKEFDNYEEVIEYWFLYRKQMYIKRIERQLILLKLEIEYYINLIRFINMDEKKEINIDKKKEAERIKILSENNFVMFNKTNLFTPKYIKTEELQDYILKYGADYKYIDSITKGMTEESYLKKLQDNLQKLKDKYEQLKSSTWKDIWLNEIEKLEQSINEGVNSNWLYGTTKHKFKKAINYNKK